jgi:leucyl-tRNA synthetase
VLANEEVTNEGPLRARQSPGVQAAAEAVDAAHHRVRGALLAGLDDVDWPEPIKLMQRNWIGRSEGAMVDFPVSGTVDEVIASSRPGPDTLFGATYMVLAPEHPLVAQITTDEQREAVDAYERRPRRRPSSTAGRGQEPRPASSPASFAVNPVTGERIPDLDRRLRADGLRHRRDHGRARPRHARLRVRRTFDLPITQVVDPPGRGRGLRDAGTPVRARAGIPTAANDVSLNGLPTDSRRPSPPTGSRRTAWLGEDRPHVQYKLRDWLFSRQRYWGEPFPILHCSEPARSSAWTKPTCPSSCRRWKTFPPRPATTPKPRRSRRWARAGLELAHGRDDGQKPYERELNTMPQWAGSCWYYLRYLRPEERRSRAILIDAEPRSSDLLDGRLGFRADAIPGKGSTSTSAVPSTPCCTCCTPGSGTRCCSTSGTCRTPEPFGRLFNQGYIQAYCYRDERGICRARRRGGQRRRQARSRGAGQGR